MRKEGPEVGESKKDEENIRFFHLHGEKLIGKVLSHLLS